MLIIKNNNTDPAFNLALEEILLKDFAEDVFMLWQNKNAVIVGKNQNTLQEVDCDYVQSNGISVVRRMTGGGAVYHDMGNLNYTFIRRGEGDKFLDFAHFNRPIIALLKNLGFKAVTSERNDILVDGKKISGGAQTMHRGSVLHHGTLMFGVNIEVLVKALKPNPLKLQSKAIASVKSRVGNLNDIAGRRIDIEEFKRAAEELTESMFNHTDYLNADKDEGLLGRVNELKEKKYSTWEWNFGYSPDYTLANESYTAAGLIQVKARVHGGRIEDVKFFGDFSGLEPIEGLENLLKGVEHNYDCVKNALNKIDTKKYINNAKKEEIIVLLT